MTTSMLDPLFEEPQPVPSELAVLVDRLRSAVVAVNDAGSLEHRRARVAAQHLEFEIAPLVEALDLEDVVARIREAAVAKYKEEEQSHEVLMVSTNVRLAQAQTAQITARPAQSGAVQIFRIDCAPGFLIHDIRIGNHSQFDQMRSMRSEDLSGRRLRLEPLLTAMDFVMVVEYVGPDADGVPFTASLRSKRLSDDAVTAARAHRDAQRIETP